MLISRFINCYTKCQNTECYYAEGHYTNYYVSFIVMLNVTLLSVVTLIVAVPHTQLAKENFSDNIFLHFVLSLISTCHPGSGIKNFS